MHISFSSDGWEGQNNSSRCGKIAYKIKSEFFKRSFYRRGRCIGINSCFINAFSKPAHLINKLSFRVGIKHFKCFFKNSLLKKDVIYNPFKLSYGINLCSFHIKLFKNRSFIYFHDCQSFNKGKLSVFQSKAPYFNIIIHSIITPKVTEANSLYIFCFRA